MSLIDKKAKKILFDTFWKGGGWVDSSQRKAPPEDFEYAKAQGLMFDPLTISHDALIERIVTLAQNVTADKAARAFLCGLSTRRVDWRSGLASWRVARRLLKHAYQEHVRVVGYSYQGGLAIPHRARECMICGGQESYIDEDLNILNFERVRWGGVRHGRLVYTLLDIEQLNASAIPAPSPEDVRVLREILRTISSSAPKDAPGTLRSRLKGIVPATKDELSYLLETLACIGVLESPTTPRSQLGGHHDWHFMVNWRGEDTFNETVVEELFGAWL